MSNTTIIEINGVKLKVDLRTAKRVDKLKVGDTVKVLKKDYSSYESFPGVIVGFDAFEKLPTIIVVYLKNKYSETSLIETLYYNSESKDLEIVSANEHDLAFDKSEILSRFDKDIAKKNQEIAELESKRKYFMHHFQKSFVDFKKDI